jgi:hypothetical protein
VIDPAKTRDLETYAAETLCQVELNFLPGFFDTMTHLPIHLPLQLALCGPVQLVLWNQEVHGGPHVLRQGYVEAGSMHGIRIYGGREPGLLHRILSALPAY